MHVHNYGKINCNYLTKGQKVYRMIIQNQSCHRYDHVAVKYVLLFSQI